MDETTVKLANDNFTEVAKIILEGVGGKGNVASIDNCIKDFVWKSKITQLLMKRKLNQPVLPV